MASKENKLELNLEKEFGSDHEEVCPEIINFIVKFRIKRFFDEDFGDTLFGHEIGNFAQFLLENIKGMSLEEQKLLLKERAMKTISLYGAMIVPLLVDELGVSISDEEIESLGVVRYTKEELLRMEHLNFNMSPESATENLIEEVKLPKKYWEDVLENKVGKICRTSSHEIKALITIAMGSEAKNLRDVYKEMRNEDGLNPTFTALGSP